MTDTADRSAPPRWVGWCCIAILALGSFQFLGHLLGNSTMRGLGAACGFAPYTKVFSDVDGFETFAAGFTLILHHRDGTETNIPVTPDFYQQLEGPYNRRNVYGAALSYAPRLPEPMWHSVFCYGFNGPLRDEFGIPEDITSISIRIVTHTTGRSESWLFTPPCLE